METTAPSQRQKRSRVASEDDEAGDTAGAARGSSRLAAAGIDGAVAEKKSAETLLFIQGEDEEAAFMEEPDDGTPPHALREIDFFYVYPPDDGGGGATAGLFAADQEPVDEVVDDLQLHLHGVPFSASPAGPKLDDPFWYPLSSSRSRPMIPATYRHRRRRTDAPSWSSLTTRLIVSFRRGTTASSSLSWTTQPIVPPPCWSCT
jgi:hypothetical protein